MRTKVNFELSIEISKDVCPSFHERGKKTKFWVLHEESKLRPLVSALLCSTTEPQRIHNEPGPFESYVGHTSSVIPGVAMSKAS